MKQLERSTMSPWQVDASDLQHHDVDDFEFSLLHSTNVIDRFLSDKNVDKLIIVATKGYGKTLLLQAKRLKLQQGRKTSRSGIHMMPSNVLVDRPIATPSILSYDSLKQMIESPDYWKNVWLISIIVAILKHHAREVELKSNSLRAITGSPRLTSVFDIFDQILQLSKREVLLCYEDLKNFLVPEFRGLHNATFVFIDNVDEYFSAFIAVSNRLSMVGATDPALWYLSQLGLAIAARELAIINPHIKICASIRKEVFSRTRGYASRGYGDIMTQVRGRHLELKYSREDLLEIMKKNIDAEDPYNLASPKAKNVFASFVGEENRYLLHPRTGEEERVEDYMLRHTLGRPRDISIIGGRVSQIPPLRRTAATIASAVNNAARDLAIDYLNEIRPHVGHLDFEILRPLITRNIIGRDEMRDISKQYDEKWRQLGREASAEGCHVFCNLYGVGLIGVVEEDRRSKMRRQTFVAPGDVDANETNILPDSDYFLVHPVLDEYIAISNPSYWNSFDKVNIVGHHRVWRSVQDFYFVIAGDVVDSSRYSKDNYLMSRFRKALRENVARAASKLDFGEVTAGDGVLLIDKSPRAVWEAARQIWAQLREGELSADMRFGGDSGLIIFERGPDGSSRELPTGRSLMISSRLEAFSMPNELLVTEDYARRAAECEHDIFKRVIPSRRKNILHIDGAFNVAKPKAAPLLVHLFSAKLAR